MILTTDDLWALAIIWSTSLAVAFSVGLVRGSR